ncbi:MAG: hypothetical protein FWH11_06440 [Micrococcales bacterium]|nr:hypothetical protein [Micrococcales bacterium]
MSEQVVLRNLPDGTKARLRAHARRHLRRPSPEAEARVILQEVLGEGGGPSLRRYLDGAAAFRAEFGGVELERPEYTDYEPRDPFA